MKILLTGPTGQVGSALLDSLQAMGEVIAADRGTLDLSKPDSIRAAVRSIQPRLIVNPAAYTAVDKAESEPELAHAINAEAPAILALEAAALGAALIHYSTDYVFNGSKRDAQGKDLPYVETDETGPLNVYGKTKLAGEQAIAASGCAYLIFRTSWVYSRHGHNFLQTMLRLARDRDSLNIVNDQWGAPTWAGWIAQATAEVIGKLNSAAGPVADGQAWLKTWQARSGIYHLSSQGCTSWCGFAQAIMEEAAALEMLDKAAPQIHGIPSSGYPTPAQRPQNSRMSTDKLQSSFALQPPPWREALAQCLRTQ
jgi:dTDP-4-dehydrorhamnose reductase